jgi:hypothetical protein
MDPALEGTVLSFDCPPQQVLTGPNTTTCMGNGEWEPDPREVECKGIMLCYTIVVIISFTLLETWECDYGMSCFHCRFGS